MPEKFRCRPLARNLARNFQIAGLAVGAPFLQDAISRFPIRHLRNGRMPDIRASSGTGDDHDPVADRKQEPLHPLTDMQAFAVMDMDGRAITTGHPLAPDAELERAEILLQASEAYVLQKSLQSETDTQKVAEAKIALSELPDAVMPALKRRLEDSNQGVRIDTARILMYMGQRAVPAIPELLACLSDKRDLVRQAALDALVAIGPEAALDLGAMLKRAPGSRLPLLRTLGSMGANAEPCLPHLMEIIKKGKKVSKRESDAVTAVLKKIGKPAIAHLQAISEDDDLRAQALKILDAMAREPSLASFFKRGPEIVTDGPVYGPMTVQQLIGNEIRRLRQARNWHAQELGYKSSYQHGGRRVGIAAEMIRRFEKGTFALWWPRLREKLEAIETALDAKGQLTSLLDKYGTTP